MAPSPKRAETRRNDPCPCGSGLKFKRCCMDAARRDELRFAAMAVNRELQRRENIGHELGLDEHPSRFLPED